MVDFYEQDTSWVWHDYRQPDVVVELRWVFEPGREPDGGKWLQGLGAEGAPVNLSQLPILGLDVPQSKEHGAEIAEAWFAARRTT